MDAMKQLAHSYDISTKVAQVFQKRTKVAQEHFTERLTKAFNDNVAGLAEKPLAPWDVWSNWYEYSTDFAQRSILFWDTLRERGNNFVERNRQGLPPVLHFDYETRRRRPQARSSPVNYALVRIVPPEGVTVDPKRRPYMIIDPRAGHGPGIGGFKDDSQVGVALREGHPVYFVIFFPDPEPGQTLLDVCAAEQQFVRKVRELHPDSAKPAIVGNCQGGWAAMMLAAADPDDTGPIVINGAPMSYWGGAWSEGAGDNPMRYAGGMLGGTWLSSFAADLGDGVFDGAYLVENFENLNPANTFWDKYYHLFANVDTEPPRFLEFERWWGGFYLMNREEIEWITRNLFVGNKLWTGGAQMKGGKTFDLREIKAPIVLFASMGDNITPPQQAFNWVADVYGSTDEIKARGQVIVGLLHEDIGHLGIFVSGKVAKKEHAQIVSVLKSIEALPPGLYGMEIHEVKGRNGKVEYEVEFHERRLEEIVARLQPLRARRREAVRGGRRAVGVQPARVRALRAAADPVDGQRTDGEARAAVPSAALPALGVLRPQSVARLARARGEDGEGAAPAGRRRRSGAQGRGDGVRGDQRVARLLPRRPRRDERGDVLPDLRQRVLAVPRRQARGRSARAERIAEPRELPFVKEALASIEEGGYPEALARVGALLARRGAPLPLARLALKQELIGEYGDLLPDVTPDQWRRIRGEQDIIVRYEPERAIAALPILLRDPADRERLITLARRLLADERMQRAKPSSEQIAMLENIGETLDVRAEAPGAAAVPRTKPARKPREAAVREASAGRRIDARRRWNANTRNTSACSTSARRCRRRRRRSRTRATRARCGAPSMRRRWG